MTRHLMNTTLLDTATWRLQGDSEKQAFVPQGMTDPAAGGMPPGDPMMGGGMPPGDPAMGGMPPMPPGDPMGGMPPMPPGDPMMGDGMPPMAPPMAPPASPPADPAVGGAGAPGGKAKIDPNFLYMELARVRKLLTHLLTSTGVDMPPDILDDGVVASVATGQQPESAPIAPGAGAPPAPAPGLPGIGESAPISPIGPAGGPEKMGSDVLSVFRKHAPDPIRPDFTALESRIDAISAMSRSLNQ